MTDEWLPFGMEDEDEIAQFNALREGFEGPLGSYVEQWLTRAFSPGGYTFDAYARPLILKFNLPYSVWSDIPGTFVRRVLSELDPLRFIDYTIAHVSDRGSRSALERDLIAGRSVWSVGERGDYFGLVRRVDPVISAQAERASTAPTAGSHIAKAWDCLYAPTPDYGLAALEAAKAVEAAYGHRFEPNNLVRTGSSINGVMRNGKAKWAVRTSIEPKQRPPQEVVLGMLEMVWTLRDGAHAATPGSPGGRTREEATLAVSLAVTLVNLAEDGVVVSTAPTAS